MESLAYQRFAITVPPGMAGLIESMCKTEGRNRSEFFREAVRHYIASKTGSLQPQFVIPSLDEDLQSNPTHHFSEWHSEADSAYDVLA